MTESLCGPLGRADLESGRRHSIFVDCMIAAIALAAGAPIAAANEEAFGPVVAADPTMA